MARSRGNVWRIWMPRGCLISASMIIVATLLWPMLGHATSPAHLCETAARTAAQRHGVPLDVLRAIALTETGRTRNGQLEPWPWAINTGGPGHWPETRNDALALVRARLSQGRTNVDLGCFQVNYRWHGENFSSLESMIDPDTNADYAARLLRAHKARLGSWEAAAGAYHSGTPALAQRYIARFRTLRGKGGGSGEMMATAAPAPASTPAARVRENRYDLLRPGGEQRLGSLVPTAGTAESRPLIPLDRMTQ